jgi:hypothetical protein
MNSTDGNGKVGSWNPNMYGEVVVDRSNRRIGKIETFAVDEKRLAPEWLVVKTSSSGGADLCRFKTPGKKGASSVFHSQKT